MNKAFVKESDETDDDLDLAQPDVPGRNEELHHAGRASAVAGRIAASARCRAPEVVKLVSWAASNGDRSENGDYIYGKRRLREIDRRIRFLTKRLDLAEVVDSSKQENADQVFFGATVDYAARRRRNPHGDDRRHRRGRSGSRARQLDFTDRACAPEGEDRRYGGAAHASGRSADRHSRCLLSARCVRSRERSGDKKGAASGAFSTAILPVRLRSGDACQPLPKPGSTSTKRPRR